MKAFIEDLGDASSISAIISHNFNAIELIGLREMMMDGDIRRPDQYEQIWRQNHRLADDEPSTLYLDPSADVAAE